MSVPDDVPNHSPSGAAGWAPAFAVDPAQVAEIHEQIRLLKRARPEPRARRAIDRGFQRAGMVGLVAVLVTAIALYVGTTKLALAIAVAVEVAALLLGYIVFFVMDVARINRARAAYDYDGRAGHVPLEAYFVHALIAYDESVLRFVADEAAWLAKRQGRALSVVMRLIWYPLLIAALSSAFAQASLIPHQWSLVSILFAVASIIYGLARGNDVEDHERYEKLVTQAADLSAKRAEAEAAEEGRT